MCVLWTRLTPSRQWICSKPTVTLRKNKQNMGNRIITVKAVTRKEMLDALGVPQHPAAAAGGGSGMSRPPMGRPVLDDRSSDRRPLIDRMPMERGAMGERAPLLESPTDWAMNPNHENLPGELQSFGKPGCVVGAKNIPYRASIDEMLDFFRDFNLTKENIIRRYNIKGQPTGEARIAFRSPSEAQQAVRELNQQYVGGRPCSLFIL